MPFSAIRPVSPGKTVMTSHVLALNAYHGGSHRAFLEGWSSRSRHKFTALTLPASKWKWRMRHAAVSFAEMLREPRLTNRDFDVLFCTDMLNLAEFRGLCPANVRDLPAIVYFHENQLTYPQQVVHERDLQFAFTNFTTCLAAETAWFNSAFHRTEFLDALLNWLPQMPDYQPVNSVETIAGKSSVFSPGVELIGPNPQRQPREKPLHVVWVSRWEYDKNPDTFFTAMQMLQNSGTDFRVSILGESYREIPPCFTNAKRDFSERILHWGYAESREEYRQILQQADVVVSTALHEFFGIAIVEAVSAGCHPLVPDRLAYPEVLGPDPRRFYDGSADGLAKKLCTLAEPDRLLELRTSRIQTAETVARFGWDIAVPAFDDALQAVRL